MAKGNNKWLFIALALIAVLVLVAVFVKGNSKPKGVGVDVEKAEQRTIFEKVAASGKIFPETEVKISSDVSGEIVDLYVEEGDSVVAGQLLAKIDPEAYFSQVEQGEAGLNQSRSGLANAESQIENSRASKEQIFATLENARVVHQRNIQQLKTNLSRTSIKAPTSGIVSSLSVEQGERVVGTIQMAGTEMMRIANLNSMEVQVDVSENDILRVKEGDMVDIEVDAYMEKKFKGKVTEIANSASNIQTASMQLNSDQVTNFIVKIRIDQDSYKGMTTSESKYPFRPGMSASVDIYTNEEKDVLSIPIQAVTVREKEGLEDKDDDDIDEDDLRTVVFTIKNDTAHMAEVVTGIQDDEYIVIKSGLEVDEEIIIGPYQAVSKKLESGKNVNIREKKKDKKD